VGATENARPENAGLENDGQHLANSEQNYGVWKMQDWKMTDNILANSEQNYGIWKMQDWKMTDKILANSEQNYGGLENAGLENDGPC